MSRELRAFREANEPPKKKALSADDRFTNVTNIWKFLVARKKGKKEKQREIALEKFLKWFEGEEESRSGIGRREKLWKRRWVLAVYVVTIFSRENLARIGRLSNPRVLKTLFCSVLLHLGRGMLLEI